MAQNLIDLDYTADALAAIDAALTALEAGFAGLLALTPDQRQMLTKMGDKSEAFCRKADAVFGENLGILPATSTCRPTVAIWPRWMRCVRAWRGCPS